MVVCDFGSGHEVRILIQRRIWCQPRQCEENSSACVRGSSSDNQRYLEVFNVGHSARATGIVEIDELNSLGRKFTLSPNSTHA